MWEQNVSIVFLRVTVNHSRNTREVRISVLSLTLVPYHYDSEFISSMPKIGQYVVHITVCVLITAVRFVFQLNLS